MNTASEPLREDAGCGLPFLPQRRSKNRLGLTSCSIGFEEGNGRRFSVCKEFHD
jgi:hypothetical protein